MVQGHVKLDLSKLEFVKGSLQNKIMRIALNKAAAPVKATVVSTAPADKGNLKKSVRIKTKHYKQGNVWVAVIGPSTSFTRAGKKVKRGPNKGQKRVIKPAKYAPLVEKKKGFLKASLSSSQNTFKEALQASIREQLAAAFNKN